MPTVRARQLGRELHSAIAKTGKNASAMATSLAWSPSKMSRLLSGKRTASVPDVAALLALCGVVGDHRDEVLELAKDPYDPIWWQDHGARLPISPRTLADNEDIATLITSFHNALVPDLLQVPDYTRALLASMPQIPGAEIEERVAETVRRQQIIERRWAPAIRVLLAEYALTRTGAGDAIMSDQLHHLLRLAVRPDIIVQVVPETSGVRDTTPFSVLSFFDLPPVVYIEHPTSATFLERTETINAYQRVLADLEHHALDERASRDVLADIAARRSRR